MEQDEPKPSWRRSTRCGSNACVEIAKQQDQYLVRDSKNPDGPVLTFTPTEWIAFKAGMVAGEFD